MIKFLLTAFVISNFTCRVLAASYSLEEATVMARSSAQQYKFVAQNAILSGGAPEQFRTTPETFKLYYQMEVTPYQLLPRLPRH